MIGSSLQVGTEDSTQQRSIIYAAVLGAGPHGRAIQESFVSTRLVVEIFDDDPSFNLEPLDWGARAYNWVVGAAWPWTRRAIAQRMLTVEGVKPAWGKGVVVLEGAKVSHEADWGHHVHICQNAVVSHGCYLGDFVTVCPGAILCGDVKVGADVLIGAGAVVLHTGITIGNGAKIGAGAVVTQDVPANTTAVGNPARFVRPDQGFR